MKDTTEYDPTVADRDGERVVVDTETGTELVVVGPSFATNTNSRARWHTPDTDALAEVSPGCDTHALIEDGEDWQWHPRDRLHDRVEQCAYCSGDSDRAEHSAKGGNAKDNLASQLRDMDPAEFDQKVGIGPMPDGGQPVSGGGDVECPACGEVSDVCYRCDSCGRDLASADASTETRDQQPPAVNDSEDDS